MVRTQAAVLGLVMFFSALPATAQTQDAKTLLTAVAKTMGTENLKTLHYSGAGSLSGPGLPDNPDIPSSLIRLKSYQRDLDLDATASRVTLVRVQNNADQQQAQTIGPNSSWDAQYDFWLTPYGFLKGAMTHDVSLKQETVLGEKYNVVSFMVQNKYKVSGYINDKNMVEKVETQVSNGVEAQHIYLEYEDFGGLKFPTTIIHRQNGNNRMILIVDAVKPNAPVKIDPAAGN